MQDEEMIELILKGDSELYAELIDRYGSRLYSISYSYTHNQEEAKDLVQEIFIKIYNNLFSFKSKAKFSTWLYRITVNTCIDWTRSKKTKQNSVMTVWGDEDSSILDNIGIEDDGPEKIMLMREHQEAVRNAVSSLPEIYKTALILYYFEDLQVQEICKILDCPRKTVETRLYRAKSMLKALLSKDLSGGGLYELQNI